MQEERGVLRTPGQPVTIRYFTRFPRLAVAVAVPETSPLRTGAPVAALGPRELRALALPVKETMAAIRIRTLAAAGVGLGRLALMLARTSVVTVALGLRVPSTELLRLGLVVAVVVAPLMDQVVLEAAVMLTAVVLASLAVLAQPTRAAAAALCWVR